MDSAERKRYAWFALCAAAVILFFISARAVSGEERTPIEEHRPVYNREMLTKREKEFVSGREGSLAVGCMTNPDPIAYVSRKDKEVYGVVRDIMERISQKTGLKFRYQSLPTENMTPEKLKMEEIELAVQVSYEEDQSDDSDASQTEAFFASDLVILSHREDLFSKDKKLKAALISGQDDLEQCVRDRYPAFQVEYFDTIEDGMKAIVKGKADCMIQDRYAVECLLNKPQYQDLRIASKAGITAFYRLAPVVGSDLTDEENEILLSVLNKAIRTLTEEDVSQILIDETMERKYELNFGDMIYQYRYRIVIMVFAFLAAVGAVTYMFEMRMRTQNMEQLHREEKKQKLLIEKTEQIIYEVDLLKKEIRTSDTFWEKFGWTPAGPFQSLERKDLVKIWRVHSKDRDMFVQSFQQSLKGEKDSDMIVRFICADRRFLWCRIEQILIRDSAGNPQMILGLIRDIDQEEREKQILAEKSRRDPLTGLFNKEAFKEQSALYLRETTEDCAVIFVDMDNFKQVNDHLGHMIGDRAICDTAAVLSATFSQKDMVARFGGDEFCIFVKNLNEKLLQSQLDYLRERLHMEYSSGDTTVCISASIGIATSKACGNDLSRLLADADSALYISKESGKDRYTYYQG